MNAGAINSQNKSELTAEFSQIAINEANELTTLFNAVNNLHDVYYDKSKWASIYPKIAFIAERLNNFLSKQPYLSISLLQIYIKQHGYTTNLVVNQVVLSFLIAEATGLNAKARNQVMEASLILYLCVRNENNLLSQQAKLNAQQQKAWQSRYLQASRLLTKYTNGMKNVRRLLGNFAQFGSGKRVASFRDELFTIVWLANDLAKKITPAKAYKTVSLGQALKTLYLNKVNNQLRNIINQLTQYLPETLPGSLCKVDGKLCVYINNFSATTSIYLSLENKPSCFYGEHQTSLVYRPQIVESTRQLWSKWQAVQNFLLAHNISLQQESRQPQRLPLNDIKRAANFSLKRVVEYIAPHKTLIINLVELANTRSRASNSITDVQHAIALLGVDNLISIIELLSYQEKINELGFLNSRFLSERVNFLTRVVELLARRQNNTAFDQLNAYICKIVLFNLQSGRANVAPTKSLNSALSNYSPARLFKVSKNLQLPSASISVSKELSDVITGTITSLPCESVTQSSIVALATVGCNHVFDPNLSLTSLEQQTQSRLLNTFGYANLTEYVYDLLSLNPQNSI